MRGRQFSGFVIAGVAALVLLIAPSASAQLPAPSPCCDKVCNEDGSSTACGALGPGGDAVIAGCLDVGPLACIGGLVLNQDPPELTEGCACVLVAPDLCLNVDVPPGELGQVQSTEECTSEAVAACEAGGNVIVTPNDPDCGDPCNNNGTCDEGETPENCPADCPVDPCNNNGTCDAGETPENCPADCPVDPCNNNGTCDAGETPENCPADCPVDPCNNNGTCDAGETPENCPADCPVDPCGNGTCDAGETPQTCPDDCPVPPTECGDGVCSPNEECRKDCGNDVCDDDVDNDGDGKTDCEDKDCRGRNRSGGGDDTNPGGGGNSDGFCNPGGQKKGL